MAQHCASRLSKISHGLRSWVVRHHRGLFLALVLVTVAKANANVTTILKQMGLTTVRSDGTGYYEYLPAMLQYGDPWLKRILERPLIEAAPTLAYGTIPLGDGRRMLLYPMGVALMWAPFYGIAHGLTLIEAPELANSYSPPYMRAVRNAGTVYLLVGLLALIAFVEQYTSRPAAVLSAGLLLFGSNLFHYATFDVEFSHVYSFALISVLLWLGSRLEGDAGRWRLWVLTGAVLGLIFLVRHSNLIFAACLLVPILRRRIWSPAGYALLTVAFLVTISPQLTYYWLATGSPLASTYKMVGAGFSYLSNPNILEVLFYPGFHGLFFWSPLLFLAIGSMLYHAVVHRDGYDLIGTILFFALTFLYAAWVNPQLGAGYGHRGFIELIPLLALPLARVLFQGFLIPKLGLALALWCVPALVFALATMLGYWRGLIPHGSPAAQDALNALVALLR